MNNYWNSEFLHRFQLCACIKACLGFLFCCFTLAVASPWKLTAWFHFRSDMQWSQPTEKKLTGGTNWQAKTSTSTTWNPTPLPTIPPHMVISGLWNHSSFWQMLLLCLHSFIIFYIFLLLLIYNSKGFWYKTGGSRECLQDLSEWGRDFSMLYFPSLKNFNLNLKWKADYLSQFINSFGIETNDPSPENSWCACLRCSHSLPRTCAHKNSPLKIQRMCFKGKTAVPSSLCSFFSLIMKHCCNPCKAL